MKISASIYSNKDKDLKNLVRELDAYKVEFFHIDCNDDLTVLDDIAEIRKISDTPIDLHLITSNPEPFFERLAKMPVDQLTLQYENLSGELIIPKGIARSYGLALVSETSVDVFSNYQNLFDYILFMTTTPGKSGGSFNKENFRKIRTFRSRFPDKKIQVDGGINEGLSFILRNMGVNLAVIGSYLFRDQYIGSSILQLKSDQIDSHYRVKDFMLEKDEVPIMKSENFNFLELLKVIDKFKMGFTHIVNESGKMLGIVSNADIRKAMIKHYAQTDKIRLEDVLNKNPLFVYEEDTISEMLRAIKEVSFPVLFLPVINNNKKVSGTIKFNNLIKGES